MPSVSDERWAASIDKFGDVTKWIVAGIGATITLILGSSPVTGLGSLGVGWRLFVALAGAAAGLVALGYIFWDAVNLLRAHLTNIFTFVRDPAFAGQQDEVNRIMEGRLPNGIRSIYQLVEAKRNLNPEAAEAADINDAINTATRVAAFVIAKDRFTHLCRRLVLLTPIAVIAFGVYEWAVNPPKQEQKDNRPVTVQATVDLKTSNLSVALQGNCAVVRIDAQGSACIADGAGGSNPVNPGGNVYVAAPKRPIDLVGGLIEAIEATAKETKRLSPLELATRAAEKFIDSASDELGKRAVGFLFTEEKKVPTEGSILFVETSGSGPQPTESVHGPVQVLPFDTNSAKLPKSAEWRQPVDRLVEDLGKQSCRFEVRGFTDRRGSASHNLYLSLQRADSVARYLIDRGLSRQQIAVDPRGAFARRFETDDAPDLATNRRVEILARCRQS